MYLHQNNRVKAFNNLIFTLIIIGVGFVVSQIISAFLIKSFYPDLFSNLREMHLDDIKNYPTGFLKLIQFISSSLTFVLPSLIIAYYLGQNLKEYLLLDKYPRIDYFVLILMFMFSIIPLMNLIIYMNESIKLPAAFSDLEQSFKASEESTRNIMKILLHGDRHIDLLINLLLIAVLPAVGEELLFRGVLQKQFMTLFQNKHAAIIITAIIFSAIHFQFYGFFPRFLLGAFFGYLVIYTKSLWPAIVAHFFNNAIAVTAMFYISKRNEYIDSVEDINLMDNENYYYLLIISIILSLIIGYKLFNTRKS